MLKVLVDRCVIAGGKTSKVWAENEDKMNELRCTKSVFYEIIARRKSDPLACLRLKRGRPQLLTEALVEHIATNKSKDRNGNLNDHHMSNSCLPCRPII